MAENFQNFYVTKLREACDAVATTIYVDTVPAITEGTLVIEYANSTKHEIIHFTGVSGYGLTGCTRGLEGTTAQSHSAGVDVRQNLTAGMIDKIINGVITTENIADSAVTTAKINDGAVTADKIDFTTLGGNYSETEANTGFTWVDGKIIYKKTIKWGAMPNNSRVDKTGLFPNNANVIKIEGIATQRPSGGNALGVHNIPYTSSDNKIDTVFVSDNSIGKISIFTNTDRSGWDAYVTLYYTKTS